MKKKATIEYLLSEEGRKQSLLNGGNGEMVQYLTVECTAEIISMTRKSLGWVFDTEEPILYIGFDRYGDFGEEEDMIWGYDGYDEENECCICSYNMQYFDTPMLADQLIEWQKKRLEIIENEEKIIMDNIKVRESQWKEEFDGEKEQWIKQYGTPQLQTMETNDENINKIYLKERIEKELPGFEVTSIEYLNEVVRTYPYGYKPSEIVVNQLNVLKEKGVEAECGIADLNNWYYVSPYDETKFIEIIYVKHYLGKYFLEKKFY